MGLLVGLNTRALFLDIAVLCSLIYFLHYYCLTFLLPNLILYWCINDVYTAYFLWRIFGFTSLKSKISFDVNA